MAASLESVLAHIQRWTSPRLEELSDATLLQRFVQRRDESAFAALTARHGVMVLRSCRRVLGDAHEAEDAFQATFLILARKAHTLRQAAELPGWLHGVARRVALKARSKAIRRAAETPLTEELPDTSSDPLARLNARELLRVIDEEVERLPAAQRSAVVLCCLEGRTQEEAGRQLGWTAGSLRGHLERGRRRLQGRLERRGIALSAALAVVAVSRGEASALLLRNTVHAAMSGAIGTPAAVLAGSVLKGMLLPKLAGVITVVLTIALTASATVVWVSRGANFVGWVEERDPPSADGGSRSSTHPTPETKRKLDALGDPLPEGAVARLGTRRFHAGLIASLIFAPDGKRLISRNNGAVNIWDAASGKELRQLQFDAVYEGGGVLDLSADGKRVAVGSAAEPRDGGHIELWDVDTAKKIGASLGERFYHLARFSPDGKRLAAVYSFAQVELWDAATQKRLRSWQAHDSQVWYLAFSADARKLLTIGLSGKVRMWDTATGRKLHEFTPTPWKSGVKGVSPLTAFSPDGNFLALSEASEKQEAKSGPATWMTRIRLWDVATGKPVRRFECSSRQEGAWYLPNFRALAFTADGKKLLTSGPDSFLRFWDAANGKELRRLECDVWPPTCLALSRDGQSLAHACFRIQVVDLLHPKKPTPPFGHLMTVDAAVLTPDGRTAVTGNLEDALLVWDVATSRVRHRFPGHTRGVRILHINPDGRTLLAGGWDKTLHVWDLSTGAERGKLNVEALRSVNGILLSSDGKIFVTRDAKQTIHLFDTDTGKERRHFQSPEAIVGLTLLADDRSLAAWCGDRKVRVWDATTGQLLRQHALRQDSHKGRPLFASAPGPSFYGAAMSSDGRLMAIANEERLQVGVKRQHFVVLQDLIAGHIVHRLDKGWMSGFVFSPDGRMLAWSDRRDNTIHLLEVSSGRERRCFSGHRGSVMTLTFSADGSRLISGSGDSTALVWDVGNRFDARNASAALKTAEVESLWADLASKDAARAYRAIHRFALSPSSAIPFMRNHLCPVPLVDEKRIARLLADLDSDDFTARQKATAELEKLGARALPAYRKALESKPSLEVRRRLEDLLEKAGPAWWDVSGERLRSLRAVEVLELAGTTEARELLRKIAAGAEGMRLTEHAKAALRRLAKFARK
jgi:RNA polymerase sigma factor (sigma-70 family)